MPDILNIEYIRIYRNDVMQCVDWNWNVF